MLCCNIRGLHKTIQELTVVFKHYDILCCSETLVSKFGHMSEFIIPGFGDLIILKCMPFLELMEWQYVLGVIFLPHIRLPLDASIMKLIKVCKVSGRQ